MWPLKFEILMNFLNKDILRGARDFIFRLKQLRIAAKVKNHCYREIGFF